MLSQPRNRQAIIAQVTQRYEPGVIALHLQPIIAEALAICKQDKYRQGTILNPVLVIWFVIMSTMRRDLSYPAVLNWMISGLRWIECNLPKKLIADGAITHGRKRLGLKVFPIILNSLVEKLMPWKPDFHEWVTVVFDGSTASMPDTESNRAKFKKSRAGRGESAYPQLRLVTLLGVATRLVIGVAYGPCRGKGTGERNLVIQIIKQVNYRQLLVLMDAGLGSFTMMKTLQKQQWEFVVKAATHHHFPSNQTRLADGSYLCKLSREVKQKQSASRQQPNRSQFETLIVRVIQYQIPGFRSQRLVTSLIDPKVTAKELVFHYHKRWDIELSFDEIKTHQCATLRGQIPTVFRSKLAELVEQELYGMLIGYNLVRGLMCAAASVHDQDPLLLSFLESLQVIIDAVPLISAAPSCQKDVRYAYLLSLLAESEIDRPARPRINPRVVKIKLSKFPRKTKKHQGEYRAIQQEFQIVPLVA